jgi:hypothetical protein
VVLIGLAAVPIRTALLAINSSPVALVCFQTLDGISASVIGVMLPLAVADITRRTGRFNLGMGILGLAGGLGATLSNLVVGRLTTLLPVIVDPPHGRIGGGGPHRVHIIIELRQTVARPPRRIGLVWWLLALILFAAAAHAQQPTKGDVWYAEPPPFGEAPSSFWSSTTWSNGVTTYTNIYMGQGRVVTCTSNTDGAGIVHTACGQ